MHLPPRDSGVGSQFRGFDTFLPIPWGRQDQQEGHLGIDAIGASLEVPVALGHPLVSPGHPLLQLLLRFSHTARSLPFSESGTSESKALYPSEKTLWKTPACSPTLSQSNFFSPQNDLSAHCGAGLGQRPRSARLCIRLGLPRGSWRVFIKSSSESMLKKGLF